MKLTRSLNTQDLDGLHSTWHACLRTLMYGEGKLSDSKVINEIKKVLTDRVKKQPDL
ncbi:hypothetical protein QUA56_13200 [Microcoleus sp. N3A4]|uniref:hypothetical protein n=1 Tax=Microcoleus sp. N3A4 TaxID=3055379 RepID=UPI002FD5CDAC